MKSAILDDEYRAHVIETLEDAHIARDIQVLEQQCPHCRLPIRYPVTIRKSDLDELSTMLKSMDELCKKYKLTEILISEMKMKCYLEIAKRDSKK